MRRLLSILVLVASLPANAGLFDALFDGCDGHRETLKVGDRLRFNVDGKDIDSDGVISRPGTSLGVETFVGSNRYHWAEKDKLQIKGEQIKWIKENFNDREGIDFFATITQMDGTTSNASCFVVASFDGLGERAEEKRKKLEQEIQCRLDFEAIPEEVGSLSKLEDLGKRCKKYDPNSNWSLFFRCDDLGECGENGKAAVAKLNRIVALENNQRQTQIDSRRSQLLAGTIKIQSLQDAELVYQSDNLDSIILSPLLKPNNKIYGNKVYSLFLDVQEEKNLIRGKIIANDRPYYVYLRTNAKTTIYFPDRLRIGANISVIGRYVSNATYTTLVGAKKLAPVLDVMFIE